jgi:hypothetical protein
MENLLYILHKNLYKILYIFVYIVQKIQRKNGGIFMIQTILALATILWVFIDWVKPLYEKFKYSRYVTIGISVLCGMLQAFMFKLDLLTAVGVVEAATVWGTIYAGLVISGGSALVNKVLDAIKNIGQNAE